MTADQEWEHAILEIVAAGVVFDGPIPPQLLDDLRCDSCERQDREGFPGLCDGCLEALEDGEPA